jgi:micrococcal nuclease
MGGKYMKLKKINLISSLVFVAVAGFYLLHEMDIFSKPDAGDAFVRVTRVYDGDTVAVVLNGEKEKVRLIGIDAPEMGQEPWGEEAKKYLGSLVNSSGWKVKIEYDAEKRDQYGRLLAYLWSTDGRLMNLQMVKNGYALLYTIPPNLKHVSEFRSAQHEARVERRGVWSAGGLKERPRNYRREHPR